MKSKYRCESVRLCRYLYSLGFDKESKFTKDGTEYWLFDRSQELQKQYPMGICLQKEVHTLFHNIYGYGNNTPEQWYEFVSDFKNGKYMHRLNVA